MVATIQEQLWIFFDEVYPCGQRKAIPMAVLNPMWKQGMFAIPFMTRLGRTNLWGNWSITRETVMSPGIQSYESVARTLASLQKI